MAQKIWRRAANGTWVLVGDQDEIPLMDARLDTLEARSNTWNLAWGTQFIRKNNELQRNGAETYFATSGAPYGLDFAETMTFVADRRYKISRTVRAYGVDAGAGVQSSVNFRIQFNGVSYLNGMGDIWHSKAANVAWNNIYLEWVVECTDGTPTTGNENRIPPGTFSFQIVIHSLSTGNHYFWTTGSRLMVEDIGPTFRVLPYPQVP